jgi:hypothetical protein
MRNKIRYSLKTENGSVHRESRQSRPGMAKDLDPSNKTDSWQRVQAGSTVVKELRNASSRFSLKPELRPSAAAVEAEKHNPKVAGKGKEYGDQRQIDGNYRKVMIDPNNCRMLRITMMNLKTNFAPQRRSLWPKKSQLQSPIQPILIFFRNLHDGDEFAMDVVTMGGSFDLISTAEHVHDNYGFMRKYFPQFYVHKHDTYMYSNVCMAFNTPQEESLRESSNILHGGH